MKRKRLVVMGVCALLVGTGLMGVTMAYESDDGLGEFRQIAEEYGMEKIDKRLDVFLLRKLSDDDCAKLSKELHMSAMMKGMASSEHHVDGPGGTFVLLHQQYSVEDEWGWRKVTFDYHREGYTYLTFEGSKLGIGEWLRKRISGAKP